MWEEIFNLALSNGLWAVLFLGLLAYVLRDSRRRERKYQATVDALVERLKTVAEIKSDTDRILTAVRPAEEGV